MTLERWLPGRVMWLIGPGIVSNLLVLALAVPWAASVIHVDGDSLQLYLLTSTMLGALLQASLSGFSLTRLPGFRALSAGRVTLTPQARLEAIAELARFPGFMTRLSLSGWFGGALVLGLVTRVLGGTSWWILPHLLVVGGLFGVLSTLLLTLRLGARAHEARDRLSEGLPPHEVLGLVPPGAGSIRGRAVLFTLAITLVPLVIAADLSWGAFGQASARLHALSPDVRAAAAEALFEQAALRLLALALFAALLAAIIGSAAGRAVAQPMQRLALEAQRVARGDLVTPQVIAADAEVARVTAVFAQLLERLGALVGKVLEAERQLALATDSLQRTSTQSEQSVERQAAALHQTSATTEELARSARQIAQSAASVQELAHRTLAAAEAGKHDASAFQSAVDRMRHDNRSIAAAVDRLQRRVLQIGRIVELINTVADRSDLLALSAELEGTRAGEVGRGFALVGAEMRSLAENVLESTAEVEELIAEIRDATLKTAEATERANTLTTHGTGLADAVTQSLGDVARLALETSTEVRTISLATQQQQSSTDQLAEAMSDTLSGTQSGLETSRSLAEVNARLLRLSTSLLGLAQRFTRTPSR